MRTQSVLFVAVAAMAFFVGSTEAIKCYSCIYADNYDGPIPPQVIGDAPAQDSRCGKTIGDGLTAGTYPDTSRYDFVVGFNVPTFKNLTSEQVNKIQDMAKFFQAPESTGVKAGSPYKVYCARLSGDVGGNVGEITMRGVAASDSLVVYDGCINNGGMRVCTCSDDECNSASGIQLSLGLIAVTLIGKIFF